MALEKHFQVIQTRHLPVGEHRKEENINRWFVSMTYKDVSFTQTLYLNDDSVRLFIPCIFPTWFAYYPPPQYTLSFLGQGNQELLPDFISHYVTMVMDLES